MTLSQTRGPCYPCRYDPLSEPHIRLAEPSFHEGSAVASGRWFPGERSFGGRGASPCAQKLALAFDALSYDGRVCESQDPMRRCGVPCAAEKPRMRSFRLRVRGDLRELSGGLLRAAGHGRVPCAVDRSGLRVVRDLSTRGKRVRPCPCKTADQRCLTPKVR